MIKFFDKFLRRTNNLDYVAIGFRNLLKQSINPEDYRQRTLELTSKGKSVKDKVLKLLG